MMTPFRQALRQNLHVLLLAALACAISIGWFFLDGDVNVNFADEGYLWYGTHAVRAGQVPMRDFHAYDPGRYLWTVGWSFLLGEGLVSMRLACVFFQCLGVLAGLLASRRLSRNGLFLTCIALLLCAWMHPRYKVFEQSIALMFVYAGVLLIERPTTRRHFCVGIFGGLMAFMGRNHGAYHVVAFGLIILWVAWGEGFRVWWQRSFSWGIGLLIGYLPQWLMFLFVPGYFRQFLVNIHEIAVKGTNLPAKVMWPWLVPAEVPWLVRSAKITEGLFYVALPLFLVLAVLRMWRLRRAGLAAHPVFIAAASVTLPYTHYVFSRPDIVHLSHGAPTLVLGVVALGFTFGRTGMWLAPAMMVASFVANIFAFGVTLQMISPPGSLFALDVAGQRMLAPVNRAQVLASAHKLGSELAKPDEAIFFVPNLPGLYPFTGRLSPTKQIYFIFPASPEEDQALVAELEAARVQWVMMHDYALDGREVLRFRNAYPIVFEFFHQNFEMVKIDTLPRDMIVLHRISKP